jgi:epsilon-lactone hydrolase
MAPDVSVEDGELGGVPVEWLRPEPPTSEGCVVFFHGGGYTSGSLASHRAFATHLASHSGRVVVSIGYRLAPEHPFPAAFDDAMAAYLALADARRPDAPRPLAVAGDSSGGGLALAVLVGSRDAGHSLPAAGVLLAPWADLTAEKSWSRRDGGDLVLDAASLRADIAAYCGAHDAADPRISPARADLAGLPPLLIQVGANDLLLDDIEELAAQLMDAGGVVDLRVWPRVWHGFQMTPGWLPEADRALDEVGAFLRGTL